MGKTMSSSEISRGTVNSGMGIEDTNIVTSEIRRKQTRDVQQAKKI